MSKWLIILIFPLLSCNNNKEKAQLSTDKMKVIIWQLMQADEYYTRASLLDSTMKINRKNVQMYQQIFDLNKVTSVQFYTTIGYLEQHPIEFKIVMDSVTALSKREKLPILTED
jgi:hypothetical protein